MNDRGLLVIHRNIVRDASRGIIAKRDILSSRRVIEVVRLCCAYDIRSAKIAIGIARKNGKILTGRTVSALIIDRIVSAAIDDHDVSRQVLIGILVKRAAM